ncbi:hypothetical protein FA95DRAFT_947710 [Auriscalpium vulgare]|uniref:Uncharacterized protein n=1 Tax=Auriscalpium vulgare TaxID=40419 RepID=A0ACB8RYI6_9AGAM|nr:hypothetical protein FA95DRAFT_947710 [Auriscalpium vulgare]
MPVATLKPINDVPLTRPILYAALQDLSTRLLAAFGHQVRLIVHGGAVMVMHPELNHRYKTQDIDYIHRAFVAHYHKLGDYGAEQRLRACIAGTAHQLGLGADWMNDHADVALPMATDTYGRKYDPISAATLSVDDNVFFSAPGLQLLRVPWVWAFALKFVRYQKDDPQDIVAMLRLGEKERKMRWDRRHLEKWVTEYCWPMGYAAYHEQMLDELRRRMRHAIKTAIAMTPPPAPGFPQPNAYYGAPRHQGSQTTHTPPAPPFPQPITRSRSHAHIPTHAQVPTHAHVPTHAYVPSPVLPARTRNGTPYPTVKDLPMTYKPSTHAATPWWMQEDYSPPVCPR